MPPTAHLTNSDSVMPKSRPLLRWPPAFGRIRRGLGAGTAVVVVAATAVASFMLMAPSPKAEEDLRYFRIGTGGSSSSYFPIGAVIANAISNPPGSRDCERGGSCGVPGLIAVAQTTGGSIENLEAIRSGILESGLSQADIAYSAYVGAGVFEKEGANEDLRAIANLYQESVHVVVRADSDIESIPQLKGKRVAVGEESTGTFVTARLVLKAYGLTEKRIKVEYMSPGASAEALRAGRIDAIVLVGGSPIPAVADLADEVAIRLLPLDGEPAQALRQKYPFLTVDVVVADTYRGVPGTVTLGVGALWVVSADLDADLVHGITRALWHSSTRKLLDNASPLGRKIRLETALNGIPIPLHPGAERFYAERNRAPEAAQSR
jgi:TRAP transporter TAXI family solute receptor